MYFCSIQQYQMGGCLSSNDRDRISSSISELSEKKSDFSGMEQITLVQQGIKIRKNPHTGRLEGVPEQWYNKYNLPFDVDKAKTVTTRNLPAEIRPEYELPQEIIEFIIKSKQRNQQFIKSMVKQKEKEREEAAQFFGHISHFTKKNVVKNDSADSSIISQFDEDVNSVMDVITSYGNEIYESKYERELLSTSQFKSKLQKVKFIEDQPARFYKFLHEIGKGSMCKVYKASDHKNQQNYYAVRIITLQVQRYLEKIKEQIAVMTLCQNKNIIQYHFSFYYKNTLFMFIQYMEYGALNLFISKYRKNIEQSVIAYIIREILKGLEAIHRRRQLHRDLKSDNILVNKSGEIKIGDFGYALQFTKQKTTSKELAGTPAWMAPQLIKKEQYTQSVDIWSLGIILVELCEGEPKYLRMKPLMAMVMIASKPPETVVGRSPQLRKFLGRCLRKDPNERATAKQLLTDPFIMSIGSGVREKKRLLEMLENIHHIFY